MIGNRKIMDLTDGAKLLGVSKSMMYRYVDQSKLKPCRREKRIRGDAILFRIKDLKEFVRARKSRMKGGDPVDEDRGNPNAR